MIEYDGIVWHNNGEYFYKAGLGYLHRYIWEKEFGKIPDGYIVHHIDEDKRNNDIANLDCMSKAKHTSLHFAGNTNTLGQIRSDETREKIRQAKLGTKASEETKKKISEGSKRVWANKEFKERMSKLKRGENNGNFKHVEGDVWINNNGELYMKKDGKIKVMNKKEIVNNLNKVELAIITK